MRPLAACIGFLPRELQALRIESSSVAAGEHAASAVRRRATAICDLQRLIEASGRQQPIRIRDASVMTLRIEIEGFAIPALRGARISQSHSKLRGDTGCPAASRVLTALII